VVSNCLIAATSVRTRERRRLGAVHLPKHNPTKLYCFLTQWPLNPEASHTNVSEETLYMHCTQPATGDASVGWDKVIPAGQTLPQLGRRWDNCAPPHGSPGHGRLRQSMDSIPESLASQLALRCSSLDHCSTREAMVGVFTLPLMCVCRLM
jgi:hypothetical protein